MKTPVTCLGLGWIAIVLLIVAIAIVGPLTSDSYRGIRTPLTMTPPVAIFPGPALTPYTTQAIFQTFERGYMVWRADYDCAYAIKTDGHAIIPAEVFTHEKADQTNYAYGYCLTETLVTDAPIVPAPAHLLVPTGVLGKLWRYYPDIRVGLGFATQPEQHYTATIPTNDSKNIAVMEGLPFYFAQMSLPNGHILGCGSRAATGGTCNDGL